MYNQNSDLMKQEKFMLPTMIEGDFSAEELAEDNIIYQGRADGN